MVLGTSAYKQGIRATTFRAEGRRRARLPRRRASSRHRSCGRTTWTCQRPSGPPSGPGRCARPPGTLSGAALGEDDSTPQRDVLADVARGVRRRPPAALAGARRPARRAVPRTVGRGDRRRGAGRTRRPRRAVRGHGDGRPARPRLPRRRRRQGGERHMTPRSDAHKCERPELRRNPGTVHAVTLPARSWPAVTAVTAPGSR